MGARALRISGISLLAALALAGGAESRPDHRVAVARDFHGVVIQQPASAGDVRKLKSAEVGAIRFAISWQATEQRPGVFRWNDVDAFIEAAAEAGAEPLPFVSVKPDWLETNRSGQPMSTPAARAAWQDFVRALVSRYGPKGSFVTEHPDVPPVTTWQLWNEPNLRNFWGADPNPSQYATLAELGSEAIREVDPDAEIMLAGLAPAKRGYTPSKFLAATLPEIEPGTFDEAAIHPYGDSLKRVRGQIKEARRAMAKAGFGAQPLAVTEIGWGTQRTLVRTLRSSLKLQARNLRDVYADLASRRNLGVSQVFWFSWRDAASEVGHCGFCATSGLLRAGGRPKPALDAFAASARKLRG